MIMEYISPATIKKASPKRIFLAIVPILILKKYRYGSSTPDRLFPEKTLAIFQQDRGLRGENE
jgi:hypothetical protein